jgi:hypothetical protein
MKNYNIFLRLQIHFPKVSILKSTGMPKLWVETRRMPALNTKPVIKYNLPDMQQYLYLFCSLSKISLYVIA